MPFLALFWGAPDGAPEGPARAPNPEDPAQGGSGGLRPTTPLPQARGWTAEPWRLPRRATQGALRAEARSRTPASPGGGAPGPGGAGRRPGPGGTPDSRRVLDWSAVVRGRSFCHRPSGPDITWARSGPAPRARSGSGSSAALGWSRGDCPPWCRRHDSGGLGGVPPYRVPTPMDDAGTPVRGPLSKCGSQTPDTGVRGYPGPRPHPGPQTDPPGTPPEGGSRGAPRGGKISGGPGGPEKFSGNSGPRRNGPPGPDPQNGTFGVYI